MNNNIFMIYVSRNGNLETVIINGVNAAAEWVAWTTSEDPATSRVDVYPAHWDPSGHLVWGSVRRYYWDWSDGPVSAADVLAELA